VAGAINPGTIPDSFTETHPDQVVLDSVWRIPEGARLEPGQRLILAHDGTNHRPFSTIDLSAASFETFVDSGRDDDHPTVSNLEEIAFNGGGDWLITVFGPSVVVLQADAPSSFVQGPFGPLHSIPSSSVLDAVEALMDEDSLAFKRLPTEVDSGFAFVSGTYVGESLHRRQLDGQFQDTDDSGADFVAGPPDPGMAVSSGEVFGEPRLELGTGYTAYENLSEGANIELIAGIQGGWHLDTSVRFGGFGPEGIELTYEAFDAASMAPVSFVTRATLSAAGLLEDGQSWIRLGDRVVMEITDPADVLGKELLIRLTASLSGQTFVDERRVVVVDED
jgi:hypothetical protein